MVVITILAIFSCSKEEDRIAANKGLTLKTVPDEDWTKIGYISGSNIYFSDLQSRLMIALENERNTYFDTTGRTNLSVDFKTVHLEKFYENVSDTLSRLCQIYLIAEGKLNDNNTSKSYSYRSSYESLLVYDNDGWLVK